MNIRRVTAVAYKEWREIIRDRLFFSLAFIVPASLMILIGYGFRFDVENIPFAIMDSDNTPMSRDYAYRFINSRYFDFKGYVSDDRVIDHLLSDNKIRMAIIIPEKFQEELSTSRPAAVQTLIDGVFPSRTQTTKGYVSAINSAFSNEMLSAYLSRRHGIPQEEADRIFQPVRLEVRYLYNQAVKSDWSIAPKLIMFIMLFSPAFITSLGVVKEKESGSIYNIYSSTVTRGEFLLGKLIPYVAVSMLNIPILWIMATGLFGAPFKGSLAFFFAASLLYVICTTGIGLIISLLVKTQMAAIIITLVMTFVPAAQYSGFMMPVEFLSRDARIIAHLLPAMYYTNIVAGCFLKGVGFYVLWQDVLALVVYATALSALAYVLFHKRVKV